MQNCKENKELREELFKLQDIKYKEFHSKLCPGTNNIIGVRIPILRKYAKEIEGKVDIFSIPNDYYEEIMIKGMLIGLEKELNYDKIQKFVPLIDNWAVCDVFCAGLKGVKKEKEKMWKFALKYIDSDKEFEVRFAVVMILDFYIDEEYIQRVLDILQKVNNKEYYAKMAVAWAYSVCFVKFFNKTKEVFDNMTKKDKFIYNKSIQKALESNRLSANQKEILRRMKV